MADPITLRRAEAADAAALSDLAFRSKAHWGYDDAFMARCRDELTVSRADIASKPIFVAELRGEAPVAGFYALDVADGVADVGLLFVEPAAMGRGIGAALWRHLEATARDLGLEAITVESDPYAEGYYRKMGCERIGEAPSVSIPGRSLPLLRRDLPRSDISGAAD